MKFIRAYEVVSKCARGRIIASNGVDFFTCLQDDLDGAYGYPSTVDGRGDWITSHDLNHIAYHAEKFDTLAQADRGW